MVWIEFSHGFEQPFVADGNQLAQIEAVPLVLFHIRDHEPQIGGDEALGGLFITLLCQTRQSPFLCGIGDQGQLLNILEILVERG